VGRKAAEGIVEFKTRSTGEMVELTADEAVDRIVSTVRAALSER